MNYQAALKDFKKAHKALMETKLDDTFLYQDGGISRKIDSISVLIIRHYTKEIKEHGHVWGSHLINIPKTTKNNEARLSNIVGLVEEIINDIQSRMEEDGETDNTSIFEDQLSAINKELDNANNRKAIWQREIKELESELKKERPQLGMVSKYVEDQERQRRNELNDKIKQRQNDLILLQGEVNGLNVEKARIEDQLKSNKGIVFEDIHGKYTLLQLINEYQKVVDTNIRQGGKLTEVTQLRENDNRKIQELETKLSNKAELYQKAATNLEKANEEIGRLEDGFKTLRSQFDDVKVNADKVTELVYTLEAEKRSLQNELKKEQNKPTVVVDKLSEAIEKEKQKLLNPKPSINYFKTFITTAFVLSIYIWFSLPKVLDITMDIRLLWGVVIVLVAVFAILILSKKDDYKNNFLILIVGLVLAFFSWLLSLK